MKLSVDDGCASDVRVADLCRKYEIEAVFYWPVEMHSLAYSKGYSPLNYGDAYEIAQDFEIGSHTITHPHLTKISLEEAIYEIIASKAMLQQLYDKPVTKFCPPRGYTNPELTEVTMNHYESQRLTKGDGIVHIHPNSGANNEVHWLDRIGKDGIENVKELWCHSWELDKYDMWDELEQFLKEQNERH